MRRTTAIPLIVLGLIGTSHLYTRYLERRAKRLVPQSGRTTRVRGGLIHWVEKGEGPPLLLIHGLAAQMQNFTYAMMDDLARDHRVIVIDRPGSGYSTRGGPRSARLSVQARMIAEFLDLERIEAPVVAGHSLGGAVALALAVEHPASVKALALLAPLARPDGTRSGVFRILSIRSRLLREALAQTVTAPVTRLRAETSVTQIFAPEPVVDDFETRGGNALATRPSGFRTPSEDIVALDDDLPRLSRRYGDLRLPVGIVLGSEDRMLDPMAQGDWAAERIAGATIERIEGAGHMLPLTRPRECADFVRRIARRAAAEDRSGGKPAPKPSAEM